MKLTLKAFSAKAMIDSIPSPNIQTSSLQNCLDPMSDMSQNHLQNDLITYADQNSIMQMQGGPLSSNSSIVNI